MSANTNLLDYTIDKLTSGTSSHDTRRVFNYQGSDITFLNDENVMVNATQMAKNFGKTTKDWLRTEQSSEYIETLSVMRKCLTTDLVEVRQGGIANMQGTWMHQDVALEFARWLSPAFAIWTNDRIKELLTTGVATINNDDETIANAMLILQKRLDSQKQKVQILEGENEIQKEQIKELAPKAQYTEQVLQSTSTFTTGQIAQGLKMSAIKLNKALHALGIQYKQSGTWMLYSKYRDKELIEIRVSKYINARTGETETTQSMVWTEKGRQFIHSLRKEGKL